MVVFFWGVSQNAAVDVSSQWRQGKQSPGLNGQLSGGSPCESMNVLRAAGGEEEIGLSPGVNIRPQTPK